MVCSLVYFQYKRQQFLPSCGHPEYSHNIEVLEKLLEILRVPEQLVEHGLATLSQPSDYEWVLKQILRFLLGTFGKSPWSLLTLLWDGVSFIEGPGMFQSLGRSCTSCFHTCNHQTATWMTCFTCCKRMQHLNTGFRGLSGVDGKHCYELENL